MQEWLYALSSVFIVSFVSLIGLVLLSFKEELLQKILLYLVSFAAGSLMADAFLHLLPEAVEEAGSFTISISLMVLLGIVISFAVEKLVQWRHCHHSPTRQHEGKHVHSFGTMNLIGDAIHNFIDGLVIGVSYMISIPLGLATTLAVLLHEIPQEIGDFGVLIHSGFSKQKAILYNFLVAIFSVAGVILALSTGIGKEIAVYIIPFAAGNFI